MCVPSVRRGSDRPSVDATDCKVLRDGDFWLWLRLIVTTKHFKTSDKSITIFFQTTKYFHRNTIHIDGVIVKVANRHGVASSLQQQPTRSLHRWRGRRAAHLAYDACPAAPPQLPRDLASPTAHLNNCSGCSCHSIGMHVLSSAVDSVNATRC